jgi:pimeloyl-ACP methyl ester carboxylesterase
MAADAAGLAENFEVIAVDQRGIGLSDKPRDGYDTATVANDLVALMDALGHQRFAMLGCDTGLLIGYALAADHPDRVDRLALGTSSSARSFRTRPERGSCPPTPSSTTSTSSRPTRRRCAAASSSTALSR